MDFVAIFEQNFELVVFSVGLIVLLTIIKFISGKILGLLIVLVLGFDAYYFTMMDRGEQLEVLTHLKKVKDTKGDYVKKIDPLDLLGKELNLKLKSNDIKSFSDLKKHLDETLILNEWKLKKIKEGEQAAISKERRAQLRDKK